jgi:tetratricopeptide (TPR) repeat protein
MLTTIVMTPDADVLAQADDLIGEALVAVTESRRADAAELIDVAIALLEESAGADHPEIAHYLILRARLARGEARLGAARADVDRAAEILRTAVVVPELASTLARLRAHALAERAAIDHGVGLFADAERRLGTALAIATAALGDDDRDVAALHNQLAVVYLDQCRLADAERGWRRALGILDKANGRDHALLEIAAVEHNLAALSRERGRVREAETLLARAVELAEGALGPDHPRVAAEVSAYGVVVAENGRAAEGEQLGRRGLAGLAAALGEHHHEVGFARSNLGAVLEAQGRHAEASAELTMAIATLERTLGGDHPDVAVALCRLARVRLATGSPGEASALHARAHAITALLEDEHPAVIVVRDLASSLAATRGRAAPAGASTVAY